MDCLISGTFSGTESEVNIWFDRSRNLRKAEAAKKQTEAQKRLLAGATATVASNGVPVAATDAVDNAIVPNEEPKVKKKQYAIKVDTQPATEAEGSDIKVEHSAASTDALEALDPAEFARQERLRKQREKQVKKNSTQN